MRYLVIPFDFVNLAITRNKGLNVENFENWNKKKFDKNLNAKRNYDLEPIIIKNHNVKINYISIFFHLAFIIFILILPNTKFRLLLLYLVAMLPILKTMYDEYAMYKNSYFKFSNDKIEFINNGKIVENLQLNSIITIMKIPQMFIFSKKKLKNISFGMKILSYISCCICVAIWIIVIAITQNLSIFLILTLIFFGLFLFFVMPQNIYQIYNSKFIFFKFVNSLEFKIFDENLHFIVIANEIEYNDIKEYFLSRLNLDIENIKIDKNYFI